jgi:replication factor A1
MAETQRVNITDLSSGIEYNSKICGLVITKTDLKSYDPVTHEQHGVMFSFTIRDETGDIEVAVFESADVHNRIQNIALNKVYEIKYFRVKPVNDEYSLTEHDYRLELTEATKIKLLGDGPGIYTPFAYPSERISSLTEDGLGAATHILGVCVGENCLTTRTTSTGRSVPYREIFVVDRSREQIQINLWENDASNFDATNNPNVYLYGARLAQFQGQLELHTVMNTMLLRSLNPIIFN